MHKQRAFTDTIGDDNPLDPLFSLGSGFLRSVSTCSSYKCVVSYSYRDLFSVKPALDVEAGGVVYEIYHSFREVCDFPHLRDSR